MFTKADHVLSMQIQLSTSKSRKHWMSICIGQWEGTRKQQEKDAGVPAPTLANGNQAIILVQEKHSRKSLK